MSQTPNKFIMSLNALVYEDSLKESLWYNSRINGRKIASFVTNRLENQMFD